MTVTSEIEIDPEETTERLYRRTTRINNMIECCSLPIILYHRLDDWQREFIMDIGSFRYLSVKQYNKLQEAYRVAAHHYEVIYDEPHDLDYESDHD